MIRRKLALLILCAIVCSFVVVPAFAQTKLNYSTFFPAPHRNSLLAAEWGKEIEKRTNGKVQFTMFYGGTLRACAEITYTIFMHLALWNNSNHHESLLA
jgi:TRAP-type C4-dicarboxylate transport system substrate-binding protein